MLAFFVFLAQLHKFIEISVQRNNNQYNCYLEIQTTFAACAIL